MPRVLVSILPDSIIPGNEASPYLEEHTTTGNPEEFMLLVQIRASEVQDYVEFEVPLHGVDSNGRFTANANGYFHAEFVPEDFTIYESDCIDCVMVNGISHVKVKVPLAGVQVGEIFKEPPAKGWWNVFAH